MSSFYTQQYQTPHVANVLANHNMSHFVGPQHILWGGWQQPTPVYLAPAQGYAIAPKQLPPDWITTRQPLPSASHRLSKPPTQVEVPAFAEPTKNIAPESIHFEKVSITQVAPPRLCPQLSSPAFLLEKDPPKFVPIVPPKMERELSDPSFLLEADPKDVDVDTAVLVEIIDEWLHDESELLAFEQARSKSIDSGSSFSESTSKHSEPVQKERQRVQTPEPAVISKVLEFHTVQRQRKERKTIKPGNVYRIKQRYVKVTREEDPYHYGKPTFKERDPNEVWTVRNKFGTINHRMKVLEVQGNRAFIHCSVHYWSKHQNKRSEAPRQKNVAGWITLKDQNGWVL